MKTAVNMKTAGHIKIAANIDLCVWRVHTSVLACVLSFLRIYVSVRACVRVFVRGCICVCACVCVLTKNRKLLPFFARDGSMSIWNGIQNNMTDSRVSGYQPWGSGHQTYLSTICECHAKLMFSLFDINICAFTNTHTHTHTHTYIHIHAHSQLSYLSVCLSVLLSVRLRHSPILFQCRR